MTQILQESQIRVEVSVSCIGEAGVTIDLGNGMYLATEWLLTAWCLIGLPVLERGMLDSRVIISHDKFNGRDAANERSNMRPTKEAAV